jgi:hypothetical protein
MADRSRRRSRAATCYRLRTLVRVAVVTSPLHSQLGCWCKRLVTPAIIEDAMDHNVAFPIYVSLDDGRVIRIENFQKILYHFEAIDIENDEYLFWDANGQGSKILIEKNAVSGFQNADNRLTLQQAIETCAKQLGLSIDTSGTLAEVWTRVQNAEQSLPRPRGLLARLFGRF